tara:strand:+ start:934 stop:1557 length:624 start_codon:yes stop_codon:yes gene_type:complete
MKTTLLAFSGGIDSTALLIRLIKEGRKVKTFTFDYGQTRSELRQVKMIVEYLGLEDHAGINLKDAIPFDQRKVIVPNRNAVFLNILWSQALIIDGDVEIGIGVTKSDFEVFPDCRDQFFAQMEDVLNLATPENVIKIDRRFVDLRKSKVILGLLKDCKKLGIDWRVLLRITHSSYGDKVGNDLSDQERAEAFKELGMIDPLIEWEKK